MSSFSLGVLNGQSMPITDTLSSSNLRDNFNITLRNLGSLDLNLGGQSINATLQLLNSSSCKVTQVGAGNVSGEDRIWSGLQPGNYTVQVELPSTTNSHFELGSTPFTLTLTADYAGNTITTADTEISTATNSSGYINTTSTGVLKDRISSATGSDPVDLYRFQVNTPINDTQSGTDVSFKLEGAPTGVTVSLLQSDGSTSVPLSYDAQTGSWFGIVGASATGTSPQPTNYYIEVTSSVNTNYTLDFAETPLTTNLTYTAEPGTTAKPKTFVTNLWEFDASGKEDSLTSGQENSITGGIDPTKPTVLIINGWNNSSLTAEQFGSDELATLAKDIVKNHPGEQVLALDWGQAAYEPLIQGLLQSGPTYSAGHVMGVANWAVSELEALGIKPSQLTLIGHSLGSFVADEIGYNESYIQFGGSKVQNLYALDPAGPIFTSYDLDEDTPGSQTPPPFSGAAQHSFSFFSNQIFPSDNGNLAATAQFSFVVDTQGNFTQFYQNHSAGISTLENLIKLNLVNSNFTALNLPALTPNQFSNAGNQVSNGGQQDGVFYISQVLGTSDSWNINEFKYVDPTGILQSIGFG